MSASRSRRRAMPPARYNRYGYQSRVNFFDYPHLAVWPDAYYMSMNVFNSAGTAYLGPQAFAFDRAEDDRGQTRPLTFIPMPLGWVLPTRRCCRPISTARLCRRRARRTRSSSFPRQQHLSQFITSTWISPPRPIRPSPSSVHLRPRRVSPNFARTRSCVPQLGGEGLGNKLDGIGDRLMFRLAYRNFGDHESLIGNFTVSVEQRGRHPLV